MPRRIIILLLTVLMLAAPAAAAAQKTFAVLPLEIQGPDDYQYLSRGAQSMLTTRLTWPDNFEPVEKGKVSETGIPDSKSGAAQTAADLGVDYLIYGSLTISGRECSLDINTVSREGESMPASRQTTLDDLIPELKSVAEEINSAVFNRPEENGEQENGEQEGKDSTRKINRMNPELVFNESRSDQEFYLNPQFKYADSPQSPGRWRSQSFNYIGLNTVICDANGNGENEVFILEEQKLHAYRYEDNRLIPLATYDTPNTYKCLNLNFMDMDRDGYMELVVSALQGEDSVKSFILNFKEDKFEVKEKHIPYFLNVVKTPPEYMKTLIGQKLDPYKMFKKDSVYEMTKSQGEYTRGRRLSVPEWGNVFNIAYLPQEDGYKIIVAHSDHLRVYSDSQNRQFTTEEVYAASSMRLKKNTAMPGLGEGKDAMEQFYFLPARLVPTNLDNDDRYELLVSRPLSVSSQFFENYRSFPQGEIHCLFWDGVGLNIFWKTRQIKGTISDYGLYDIDNDDKKELVVLVNTYPGATGLKNRKTMLLAYDLDTDEQAPAEAEQGQ
ncbi:MAG: FG-GAP-like repeat-containing protein [Desulfonatronovibrionaceae bacterium]